MWQYNGEVIKTAKEMVINDVRYPKQIFKDADLLAELGITSYTPEAVADQRYYWNTTDNPKDVAELKKNMVSKVKAQVGARLSQTDWMVIRATDGGTAVPSDVATYRTAIRTEGNTKETEINALTTIDDVIAYENASYTEVRKVAIYTENEDGTSTVSYGDETESFTRSIDKCMHFDATDPLAEVDPAFVSLTED
jgi:hypothetical protein